jgi:hypothetical protein
MPDPARVAAEKIVAQITGEIRKHTTANRREEPVWNIGPENFEPLGEDEAVEIIRAAYAGFAEVLGEAQWCAYNDPDHGPQVFCPVCRADKKNGHYPACAVGSVLATLGGNQ